MTESPQDRALEELLELVGDADAAGTPFNEARARTLAMQWPSLAAALANLLAAHNMRTPRPWRTAANLMREETPPATAPWFARMGACAKCGHVQHQHRNNARCSQCACMAFRSKAVIT
jgi:hypothetical protein